MLDLLITNGLVVDGTGSPGFYGAVGVKADEVRVLRGETSSVEAKRRIDATGQVVSPGFIDIHAHSGLVILAEPRHEPKVLQGVTTEVIGVDGHSYAPFKSPDDFKLFAELNSGLEGTPPPAARWPTMADYLAEFDGRVAVNICCLVGNAALRISAVGWTNRPATPQEIAEMKTALRESLEEGAWGLSTGLDYPPGNYADTGELVELAREVARYGGIYHTHVRNRLGDQFLDPFAEAIEIGRRSGVATHITHFFLRVPAPGGGGRLLDLVEGARSKEMDVTFDSYPYIYGNTRLLIVMPDWVHDGGPESLKAALRSPETRERLRREVVPRAATWEDMWLTNFKQPHNRRYEGRSVGNIAHSMGKGEVDAVCDLLLDEDLQVSYVAAGADPFSLPKFLAHPLSMVASDALLVGEHPSPRTYGCFPVVLGSFVREERFMSLPEAIRKMTSFPAQRLGLADRGILRDGMKADLVVFDPGQVKALSTRTNPRVHPAGIRHVIVNGQVVVDEGRHTGALPGRALRRGSPST